MGCSFDFNRWAELASQDPEAFTRLRQMVIQEHIAQREGVHQPMLQGLQFRIDMERRRARTPLKACLRVSAMMWDSFHELKAALDGVTGRPGTNGPPTATARIIAFRKVPGEVLPR